MYVCPLKTPGHMKWIKTGLLAQPPCHLFTNGKKTTTAVTKVIETNGQVLQSLLYYP